MSTPLRCVFAENEHGTYCIPHSSAHRPASKIIINGGIWEPDTIKFLNDNAGQGTIVHAGTYFGDFLPGLKNCKRVLAYEPSDENYRCAQITCLMNKLSNVELSRRGLGDHDGMGRVQVMDVHKKSMGGTSKIVHETNDTTEQVFIATIDSEVRRFGAHEEVTIIQLDIEGYEQHALMGAMTTLERQKPILVLELFNEKMLENDFYKNVIMGELGYVVDGKVHENFILRPR